MATQESRPEQALTDLHIAGTLDDIQTAQLLGHAWRVRSMFLTVLSDVAPIAREARQMPRGSDHADSGTRIEGDLAGGSLHKANAHGTKPTRTLTIGELMAASRPERMIYMKRCWQIPWPAIFSSSMLLGSVGSSRSRRSARCLCLIRKGASFGGVPAPNALRATKEPSAGRTLFGLFSSEPVEAQVPGDERRGFAR
jgi:hypothetical protein